MILKQFYLESLGHASYLVGSEESGEAFILDPQRDVSGYFAQAQNEELRIRYVADSHQHNDYGVVSANLRRALRLNSFPVLVPNLATARGG